MDDWRNPNTPPEDPADLVTESVKVMLRYADGTELKGSYLFCINDFMAHAFLTRDVDDQRELAPYLAGYVSLTGWKPLH